MPVKYFPLSAHNQYKVYGLTIKKFMIVQSNRMFKDIEGEIVPGLSTKRVQSLYIMKYPREHRLSMIKLIKKCIKRNKVIALLYEAFVNTGYLNVDQTFVMMIKKLNAKQLSIIGW